MILVDVNLLIYVYTDTLPQHDQAREWFDAQMTDGVRMGMPWHSLLGFLRMVTNPRIFSETRGLKASWEQVEAWLDRPNVWIPQTGPRHREIVGRLLDNLGGGPGLVSDAHLAALAIEHGLTLCSTDGDFARFAGLRWQNPIRVASSNPRMGLKE